MSSVAIPSPSGHSAFPRFLVFCSGVVGAGLVVGIAASVQQPRLGLVGGAILSGLLLSTLLYNQTRWILRSLGATRQPFSPALTELWRRATLRLAVIESAEAGGRRVKPRTALPRLAVFDHPGPALLALRGWSSGERWLVISRDLLERLQEEELLQAMMEGVRALDRREAQLRTSLAAAATVLCRRIPMQLIDGADPTPWSGSIARLLLVLAVLPFYSFLSGTGLGELGIGAVPVRFRNFGAPAGGGLRKKNLRRQLRRARGHLPAHLGGLALWHSGGARNVLSAVVETR